MTDTIEMLEAIGSDASLRYASTADLTHMLSKGRASNALAAAVASGDVTHLSQEFGNTANFVPQAVQTFFAPALN